MVDFFFCYLKWTCIKNPHYFISWFFPLERRICQSLSYCWHHMPWCQLKEAALNIKRVCKFHYYPSLSPLQSWLLLQILMWKKWTRTWGPCLWFPNNELRNSWDAYWECLACLFPGWVFKSTSLHKGVTEPLDYPIAANRPKLLMRNQQTSRGFTVGENFCIQLILIYICYSLYPVGFSKCFADVNYS